MRSWNFISGWRMKKTLVDKHWLIILFFCAFTVFDLNANEDETPSMELLEFLGEWETQDGEWFDPVNFLDQQERDTAVAQEEQTDD